MKKLLLLAVLLFSSLSAFASNGTLVITSFPSGADITIDGVAPANPDTPTAVSLTPGTHTVVFAASDPGWAQQTATATVVSGQTTFLDQTLLPILTTGPQGPAGPQGPQGQQGPQGATGA